LRERLRVREQPLHDGHVRLGDLRRADAVLLGESDLRCVHGFEPVRESNADL
jgi:hypothetical protein